MSSKNLKNISNLEGWGLNLVAYKRSIYLPFLRLWCFTIYSYILKQKSKYYVNYVVNDVVRVQNKSFKRFSLFIQFLFLMLLTFLLLRFLEYTSSGILMKIWSLWSFLGDSCRLRSNSICIYLMHTLLVLRL